MCNDYNARDSAISGTMDDLHQDAQLSMPEGKDYHRLHLAYHVLERDFCFESRSGFIA